MYRFSNLKQIISCIVYRIATTINICPHIIEDKLFSHSLSLCFNVLYETLFY